MNLVWLFVMVLCAFQEGNCHESHETTSCGNFMKDWFPGVSPQSAAAPYVLNVSDSDGNFDVSSWKEPRYDSERVQTVKLSGLMSGNNTTKFIGFLITARNEFDDEENGQFVAPFPAGVSRMQCKSDSQKIEEVKLNLTSGNLTSIEIKWKAPKKYPAGKITISASVIKEHGVYWEGINVTLGYICAGPLCANRCPNGYAKTKFGCTTCICAGAQAIKSGFVGLLFAVFSLFWFHLI